MPAMTTYDHRAANDIQASLATFRWLRDHALVQPAL
jgi:oligoribonuclease (3'-5' exoribonuclease)